jgi:hypothetical protein
VEFILYLVYLFLKKKLYSIFEINFYFLPFKIESRWLSVAIEGDELSKNQILMDHMVLFRCWSKLNKQVKAWNQIYFFMLTK